MTSTPSSPGKSSSGRSARIPATTILTYRRSNFCACSSRTSTSIFRPLRNRLPGGQRYRLRPDSILESLDFEVWESPP